MRGIYSFFCGISEFIMNISKKTYRTCAIITTGVCVVSVVAFASHHFGGAGKSNSFGGNGLIVYAADEESAKWQTIVDELQDVLEAQNENLMVCSEQTTKENIPDKAANDIKYVVTSKRDVTTDEDVAKAEEIVEVEIVETEIVEENATMDYEPVALDVDVEVAETATERKADSIVTTSGVPIEGVINAPIQVTEEEYNILLHIVAAESGVCDVYGQMLVANVIMNRVNNKCFPDTIEEVVFQKNQFSPATNGRLWNAKINDTTIEAVNRVLAGEDYSCGALFFVAKKYVSETTYERFNTNYSYLFEHDGHTFFKFYE